MAKSFIKFDVALYYVINKLMDEINTTFKTAVFQFYNHEMMFLWNIYHLFNFFGKSEQVRKSIVREYRECFAKLSDEVNKYYFLQLNEILYS
jgi:hypothetical protein